MAQLCARHLDGDRFAVTIRDHEITVDQPVADGGTDSAPTPTELFVAALTSCVAHYAHRYLARHELPTDGLRATAEYTMASRPSRVSEVSVVLDLPDGIPQHRLDALLAVASHCTVHNSLESPPAVAIAIRQPELAHQQH